MTPHCVLISEIILQDTSASQTAAGPPTDPPSLGELGEVVAVGVVVAQPDILSVLKLLKLGPGQPVSLSAELYQPLTKTENGVGYRFLN